MIEQMRFKQRLRVIQTLEDTTKRNVVSAVISFTILHKVANSAQYLHFNLEVTFISFNVQVRAIVTDTAFNIDELEELYVLFKVSKLYTRVIFFA